MEENEDLINKQVGIYSTQFLKHGDSPDGTFNQKKAIQDTRFKKLLEQFDLGNNDYSVHDVGCGICDTYEYLKVINPNITYSGTEIVQEMIDLVAIKHPEITVFNRDIIENPPQEKYDLVVLSGTFNLPGGIDRNEWKAFTLAMISRMFDMCTVGISFNFLTTYADFYHEDMFYISPGEILDYCNKNLSRFVIMDHSSPLFEHTTTVFRESHIAQQNPQKDLVKYFKE